MTLVYSRPKEGHVHGVGFLLGREASKALAGYWTISERFLIIKLKARRFDIMLIQIYAPTTLATEEELDKFYEMLDEAISQCNSQEMIFVFGDANSKVGQGRVADIVGPHGLGVRNENGKRLVKWCKRNG